jgi:hypothetical protein
MKIPRKYAEESIKFEWGNPRVLTREIRQISTVRYINRSQIAGETQPATTFLQ